MRKVFIADAHLRNPGDENYRILLDFLAGLEGSTDTLFILGDLFEFWIGYRNVPFHHYIPVLDQLRRLREHGVDIVYFEGNHDFHMGPFFEETLQARVFSGPAIFSLDGKQVYLCHGDQMNRKDHTYRLLRFMLHSPLTRALTLIVPPAVASLIAVWMGGKSRKSHKERRVKWDYMKIVKDFAAARFAAGCDVVVTGHFHIPFIERSGEGPKRVLLSLGDWITHFSYGEWVDGEISLKTYR
ncbi:MAG: UDP-2 3-diacylglucosamine [Geobacteraceae bacterium]|nr:MAG: UDP-2 3-diacylglucosamine [Geobacteraceae bacterium]